MHLENVCDEPIRAERARSGMTGYEVPREYSYAEELTLCATQTVSQCREYQTLDRATMDWEIARKKVGRMSKAAQIELQHSTLQGTENGPVHLQNVSDEPITAEIAGNEITGYKVLKEYSYAEELTPCTIETVSQSKEYQTLDRATMDWEIARNKVSIIKEIGEGAFGKVAKATAKGVRGIQEERTVAVKMLKGIFLYSEILEPTTIYNLHSKSVEKLKPLF